MKNLLKPGLALSALLIVQSGQTIAADTGKSRKFGDSLRYIAVQAQLNASQPKGTDKSALGRVGKDKRIKAIDVTSDGYVRIDAVASGNTNDLVTLIESLGGRNVSSFKRVVSTKFPIDRLNDLEASGYLASARPVFAKTNVGLVDSQGDEAMRSNIIRASHGLDGEGMSIGVLSDSFACTQSSLNDAGVHTTLADDRTNRDLTNTVRILEDYFGADCIDEGRGMAQLIQDVLPKAKIIFHSAYNGEADFADGILELAKSGADVIVDDISYYTEPMFQDGVVAQEADQVAAWGIPYFSSAGNSARESYQSKFRPIQASIGTVGDGLWHDFDPGNGVDILASFTTRPLGTADYRRTILSFQWDSPNFSVSGGDGAQNDVDIIMFDSTGKRIPECFDSDGYFILAYKGLCRFKTHDGGNGGDAVEVHNLIDEEGDSEIEIGFFTQSGDAPKFVKFIMFGDVFIDGEYDLGAPTTFGHHNAMGAEAVGASAFYFTEEFNGDPATRDVRGLAGEAECVPACLNAFSSAGGVPIFFDTDGNRLAEPEIRLKPGITGPDGGNTSFFFTDSNGDDDAGDGVFEADEGGEYPNFFGTSASAPHVAALAAQLLNWQGTHSLVDRGPRSPSFFRVCVLADGSISRLDGTNDEIHEDSVEERLEKGEILLHSCEATEPADLYNVIRDTAQDITIRADRHTGVTVDTFTSSPDIEGFNFESGFGFVDAEEALTKYKNDLDSRSHRED